MTLLFCNVGWMEKYDGIGGDSIARGGSYNDHSVGHEVCNFTEVDGLVYGYVQSSGQIKLEKLGASKTDTQISGITVVWTAGPDSGGTVVVGWYKNATVYREYQYLDFSSAKHTENGIDRYRIVASAKDARLLSVEDRHLVIPRATKGGIGQNNVWYALADESQAIREATISLIDDENAMRLPDVDRIEGAEEGNPRLIAHLRRERDQKIIQRKKALTLKEKGSLECEACGFDFYEFYGSAGENFCEVHHLKPLSKADGIVKTTLDDLAIVCSNCHRVIHRSNPMLTIDELANIINVSEEA
ncbi:HNH endonuclease [Desulfonema magnum]|uniref:HNH endonuclease domain-containing protein n=1 Tax=Desulfonema magnum TaxID=45655 RepID=A0A975BQX8_9BACT|nr:HNH endonuclease [Desulfonema magnum]QTA89574.1 HNH endonuclease domain-containing protein [Desulfonema magnum]